MKVVWSTIPSIHERELLAQVDNQELPETQQQLEALQNRMHDAQAQADVLEELQSELQMSSGGSFSNGFFSPDNIALWLFWGILIVFLLFMVTIRRTILRSSNLALQGSMTAIGSGTKDTARKKKNVVSVVTKTNSASSAPRSRKTLVEPVKVVKIKVHKVKKPKG